MNAHDGARFTRRPLDVDRRPAATALEDRLIDAHECAASYFADNLASSIGRCPRAYLQRRGVGAALDGAQWTIGYALRDWTGLTGRLRDSGFSDDEIALSGLGLVTRRGNLVDRFRDRLTFGIRNPVGQLVGFVGRAAPADRSDSPKYLNSPRTPIYDKSAVLFGLAEQHEAHASGAVPVLVEGPLDVLAVAAAFGGSSTPLAAVAPCGTAVTRHQVLSFAEASTSDTLVVAFDSDFAGDKAAAAAYTLLKDQMPQLRSVRLPPHDDPASLLTHRGPAELRSALVDTEPLADRIVDRTLHRYRDLADNAEARVAALHEAAALIATMPPRDVPRQVARITRALQFDHPLVTAKVAAAVTNQVQLRPPTAPRHAGSSTTRSPRRAPATQMRLP